MSIQKFLYGFLLLMNFIIYFLCWTEQYFSIHYQVVSALNCARRGWINVDIDIITCEACGARLLFSTSSSWSQEQGMFSVSFTKSGSKFF